MIYTLTDSDLNRSSAVLRVRGVDANSFLQGQFTQDIQAAPGGRSYGLWLDLMTGKKKSAISKAMKVTRTGPVTWKKSR